MSGDGATVYMYSLVRSQSAGRIASNLPGKSHSNSQAGRSSRKCSLNLFQTRQLVQKAGSSSPKGQAYLWWKTRRFSALAVVVVNDCSH